MAVLPSLEVSLTLPGFLSHREHHSREENDNDSLFTQSELCVCNTLFDKYIFKQPFGAWGPKFLDNEADVQSCSCSLREPGFRDGGQGDC